MMDSTAVDAVATTEDQRAERSHPAKGRGFALMIVGAVAAAVSLNWWVRTVQDHMDQLWQLIDLEVYREGGRTLLHHSSALYDAPLGRFGLPFLYPPLAALAFAAVSAIHFNHLTQLTTAASLLALGGSVWWSWGLARRRRSLARLGATFAVVAIALWLEPVQQTLTFGQVNLILMAIILGDLSVPDRFRVKGIGIGLAAGFKLTPAIFILYLALTRRTRAAVTAAITFAVTVIAGFVIVPSAAADYWTGGWLIGDKVGRDFVSNQSVVAVLHRLLGHYPGVLGLALAAAVGVVGLILAIQASRRGEELTGVVLCALAGLLASPISWTHHWVWVVPALVLGCDLVVRRRSWLIALAVAAVTALLLAWPARLDGTGKTDPTMPYLPAGVIWHVPHRDGREFDWRGGELVVGNLYVVLGLAGLAVAAWALQVRHQARAVTIQPAPSSATRPSTT